MSTRTEVVSINADTDWISASTYKLFAAYDMLSEVEDGSLTLDSTLNNQTLSSCITTMIHNSDNACPQAWLRTSGYSSYEQMTSKAHEIGATNTNFAYESMHTTARDLSTILRQYYDGTILNDSDRLFLINLLENQEYRSGIPSGIGSNGTVADKVGFLDAYLHDAGIVYTDNGDYIIVIMTNNSSWSTIAKASSQIYSALSA